MVNNLHDIDVSTMRVIPESNNNFLSILQNNEEVIRLTGYVNPNRMNTTEMLSQLRNREAQRREARQINSTGAEIPQIQHITNLNMREYASTIATTLTDRAIFNSLYGGSTFGHWADPPEHIRRTIESSKTRRAINKKEQYGSKILKWTNSNIHIPLGSKITNTSPFRIRKQPKSIEQELLEAINTGVSFKTKTTEYSPSYGCVRLFGRGILWMDNSKWVRRIRILGDDNYTTKLNRLRLNQLGVKCLSYKKRNRVYSPAGGFIEIPYDEIFELPPDFSNRILPEDFFLPTAELFSPAEFLVEGLGLPELPTNLEVDKTPISFKYIYADNISLPKGIRATCMPRMAGQTDMVESTMLFSTEMFRGFYTLQNAVNLIVAAIKEKLSLEVEKLKLSKLKFETYFQYGDSTIGGGGTGTYQPYGVGGGSNTFSTTRTTYQYIVNPPNLTATISTSTSASTVPSTVMRYTLR